MKLCLFVLSCVAALVAAEEPIPIYYHENVGIPQAELIRQSELANEVPVYRSTGASLASLGQYPYFGGLIIPMTSGNTSVCGCSLLSHTRAVTAAHCWWDGKDLAIHFEVILGSTHLYSGGTRITTTNVETHANHNPLTNENDIAIISISYVNFNNHINNIAIAPDSSSYAGLWAQAIGFGVNSDSEGKVGFGKQLSYVYLKVIPNKVCQQTYGPSITASKLCTSGEYGISTCHGDSGGPLVMDQFLIGVTSFVHKRGCEKGMPAGYTRVSSYASWIVERLR